MSEQRTFEVTVQRVNESEHQASEVTYEALEVHLTADGNLTIRGKPPRMHSFASTTWGSFEVVRVPSSAAAERLKGR